MILGVSTGVAVAYTVALFWTVAIAPAAVTALKGHWALFVAGFFTVGLVWVIAALRLARPDSWWAQRFYGPDKLEKARARYGGPVTTAT